jgi:uncharacterized membrane protein YfcA
MTIEFLLLVAVGFVAQLVDGALGMAFGLIATTAMLSLGLPPAQASAATHTAEVFTTGVSGLSHLYFRNIDGRLFAVLSVAGVIGGVAGAYLLSNIDGKIIRPFIAVYLLAIGLLIVVKAFRLSRVREDAKAAYAAPLGLVGGFLDAIGGGGWGPMVTSTLIGSGHAPRRVIGSVSASEFFVTVAVSTTFFIELGTSHLEHIAALVIGGVVAAPLGGFVVRRLKVHWLMGIVGVLVSSLALVQLVRAFA